MNPNDQHRHLIDAYCLGSLSDEEFAELEDLMRNDASVRRELLESRILDSDLRDFATVGQADPPAGSEDSVEKRTIHRLRVEVWAMAAAMVLLLGCVLIWWPKQVDSNVALSTEPGLDHGVAVLTRAIDAQWTDRQLRQGDSLAPGRWKLAAGTAELEFYSGASVILEAPAELEIESENGGVLHAGKLRAEVPVHAHGFTIATKDVELVDLGTSFGMEVGADTGTAVHVFDGKVELYELSGGQRPGQGVELAAGQNRRYGPVAKAIDRSIDPDSFLSPDDLDKRLEARLASSYVRWRESADSLIRDDRLLARYEFEPATRLSRTLANSSTRTQDGLIGAIIGASWATGRWPDKGAIEFKRPSDRVRIEVARAANSMSLVVWLRIDGFDNGFHSILLSDGWDRRGALHWQIHRDGFVELAVWHNDPAHTHNSRAPLPMSASDFGRWIQLAVVYNADNSSVTHYRDGNALGTVRLPVVVPIAIGKAEIGNWTPPPNDARQIRHFNGRIDEMLIFDKALPKNQIQDLYRNGKP
jgi:hypothetical protein